MQNLESTFELPGIELWRFQQDRPAFIPHQSIEPGDSSKDHIGLRVSQFDALCIELVRSRQREHFRAYGHTKVLADPRFPSPPLPGLVPRRGNNDRRDHHAHEWHQRSQNPHASAKQSLGRFVHRE